MNTEKQMAQAAAQFAERWQGKGYEKGESQAFWLDLLSNVFGIQTPTDGFIIFEEHHMVDASNFIDARIPSTRILIEQKSVDKDLRKGIRQSDGSVLTPFLQARRYVVSMPVSEHPRWIVTCNFASFLIYDMEQPNREPEEILLKDLGKDYYRLLFLVDTKNEHLSKEMQVSLQAGEIVGRIYDALLEQYNDNSPETLRWLNILCVRIVFCLYAEDAGIFRHDQFHDYLSHYDADDLRNALLRLFEVLNTPDEKRSKYLKEDLKAFPYTNGGLFDEDIEIPQFTEELKRTLLQNASLDFDWSEISPTIFGAMFESTLNPETRRSGGMHYTSIENIHKVIDPLFFNDLRRELDEILEEKVERQRQKRLDAYQERLASLTFLDPACGSGNFLTETYLSLRRLENEVIRERYHGQTMLGAFVNPIKVSIHQFHGIEINDFAVTVATTALWISEAQMLAETERIIHQDIDFLPLKEYHNIREGNALQMDWDVLEIPRNIPTIHAKTTHIFPEEQQSIVSEPATVYNEINLITSNLQFNHRVPTERQKVHFDYIIGNPPFVGARFMSQSQKDDVVNLFGKKWKNVGNMDYVCCWYKKAAELIRETDTRAAFVSTNSICQGEQVANLWQPLMKDGLRIDFAHRTFRWDSEASLNAHVHCIIVGFSQESYRRRKCLIIDNEREIEANHINAYLMDAPDVFIEKRIKPICNVPQINLGGQPIDDGNFTLTDAEKDELIQKEPQARAFIRPFMMGKDFIQRHPRFCIWLKDANPKLLHDCPQILQRIKKVKDFRLKSNRVSTLKAADLPFLFGAPVECKTTYIALPKVSSENRKYIPIDYLSPDIIPGDKIFCFEKATLYHFGVLTSNVHMAWMRAVGGRLKSDYSYSNTIVYNNFPWPTAITEAQKEKIEQTAQAILDARAKYPDSSLADLYDELTMPIELRRAHQENDRAVMQAYGFPVKSTFTESMCVAELFKMYQELTK